MRRYHLGYDADQQQHGLLLHKRSASPYFLPLITMQQLSLDEDASGLDEKGIAALAAANLLDDEAADAGQVRLNAEGDELFMQLWNEQRFFIAGEDEAGTTDSERQYGVKVCFGNMERFFLSPNYEAAKDDLVIWKASVNSSTSVTLVSRQATYSTWASATPFSPF